MLFERRTKLFQGEENTAILVQEANDTAYLLRPHCDPQALSASDVSYFLSIQRAARAMRESLRLPLTQALIDSISQERFSDILNADIQSLIAQGPVLIKKSSLVEAIEAYSKDAPYKAFHLPAPFDSIEISNTTLNQLPAETAKKARDAKQKYKATQTGKPSLIFLTKIRDMLNEMAKLQVNNGIYLSDQRAETLLDKLNAQLINAFECELATNPHFASYTITTIRSEGYTPRYTVSEILQQQPCIRLRQIYLWKLLHTFKNEFPVEKPLIIPKLIKLLASKESYNYEAMFGKQQPESPQANQNNPRPQQAIQPNETVARRNLTVWATFIAVNPIGVTLELASQIFLLIQRPAINDLLKKIKDLAKLFVCYHLLNNAGDLGKLFICYQIFSYINSRLDNNLPLLDYNLRILSR